MNGFVMSKGGTFGCIVREWRSDLTGKLMALVQWGPLGWLTPFEADDLIQLKSSFESEARKEVTKLIERADRLNK